MVCIYSKNKSGGCEFSEIMVAVVLFNPLCSSTNWCTSALSKVYGTTLNLHHFLQKKMDLKVEYL
jgi:hypothetical protein